MGKYLPNQDHKISLIKAIELTQKFRNSSGTEEWKGGFFGADAMIELLLQRDCVGFKYYFGLNDDNQKVLIVVGVDQNGKEIFQRDMIVMSLPITEKVKGVGPLV